MNPEAFSIGPLTIRWYGVFVALGFLAAFGLATRRAKQRGVPPEAIADLLFWTMVSAILGSRALYVVQNWAEFSATPLEIVRIDRGGLVFYGGFIAAVTAAILFCRIRKLELFKIADIVAPAAPLGQAFGRLGCLLNGCCFGHPHGGPCAIHYPTDSAAHYVQEIKGLVDGGASRPLPVFPLQALYSLSNLAIVCILLLAERRFNLKGQLFGLYMVLYGGARFFLEFGRGDYTATTWGFTPAQIICLLIVPGGLFIFWFGGKRSALAEKDV